MTIEQTILRNFNSLRRPTDVRQIAEQENVSVELVSRALRTGECSDRLFKSLSKYYIRRQMEIDKIINETETVNDEK
jgi:hypothetical protein